MWLVIVGLLVALAGVGGVENSLNDLQLIGATLVSLGGCLLMYAGTLLIKIRAEES